MGKTEEAATAGFMPALNFGREKSGFSVSDISGNKLVELRAYDKKITGRRKY